MKIEITKELAEAIVQAENVCYRLGNPKTRNLILGGQR